MIHVWYEENSSLLYYMYNNFIYQVFKIKVQRTEGDNWFVFRRYTDFVRLNERVSLHLKMNPIDWKYFCKIQVDIFKLEPLL